MSNIRTLSLCLFLAGCASTLNPLATGALTLNELAAHRGATGDLGRLAGLVLAGRLDCQVEFEGSWRDPRPAIEALLHRRVGGKIVLHVD